MASPSPAPRLATPLDYRVGLSQCVELGSVVLFEPRLPARERCAPADWEQIVARYDERWREWWGPVGDVVRAQATAGEITLDPATGVVRTPSAAEDLPLPARLAFVVHVEVHDVDRGRFIGDVRHVLSARHARFRSPDECVAFITQVMREAGGERRILE